MKEYKLVYLNKGLRFSREKDLEIAQKEINEYVADGWELQQIMSPSDAIGAMEVSFSRRRERITFINHKVSGHRRTCPGRSFCFKRTEVCI